MGSCKPPTFLCRIIIAYRHTLLAVYVPRRMFKNKTKTWLSDLFKINPIFNSLLYHSILIRIKFYDITDPVISIIHEYRFEVSLICLRCDLCSVSVKFHRLYLRSRYKIFLDVIKTDLQRTLIPRSDEGHPN